MNDIDKAVATLARGELIGLPTETVYGLAADATNAQAVASIFALKNRPQFNPLIAHVSNLKMAEECAEFCDLSYRLAKAFWPGPFTLVLPKTAATPVCDLARAGLDTQALRVPSHPIAREIIRRFNKPVAAPSANLSGHVSPTTAEHVRSEFGTALPLILEGGKSEVGLESTVVGVFDGEATLLRPGSISIEQIAAISGSVRSALHDDTAPRSPGMLSRHYSPDASLRLNAQTAEPGEAFLGFGPDHKNATLNLSQTGDLAEAASNLYDMIRRLDDKFSAIAVAPIPDSGIGAAINDRLYRAATPA